MALARSLGAQVPEGEMPCDCDLRDPCLAQSESQTLNVLVWVGSAAAPDAVEEATVADWLDSRADAEAIPVVPSGQKPDVVAPTRLRDRQVVWWGASADQAALDVFAAAQVVTAERSVFISYSHADGMELAHAVFRVLSEARFSVFLDAFALAPGADFAERIEHRLLNAAFLVLIETPGALASPWVVTREFGFARRYRLGVAAVSPDAAGPKLTGIGKARRWVLPNGSLDVSGGGGPVLKQPGAGDLRDFVSRHHAAAMLRRSRALDRGLRAALRRYGFADTAVRRIAGGLGVDAAGRRVAVSLRPRPASLVDMHAAADAAASGFDCGAMISATPRGRPEREALQWVADEADLVRWDEGRLLSFARDLAGGAICT
jgi:hypothetical protein